MREQVIRNCDAGSDAETLRLDTPFGWTDRRAGHLFYRPTLPTVVSLELNSRPLRNSVVRR